MSALDRCPGSRLSPELEFVSPNFAQSRAFQFLVLVALLVSLLPIASRQAAAMTITERTLWSVTKFALLDVARSADGKLFALAEDAQGNKALVIDIGPEGPGRLLPLENSKSIGQANLRLKAATDALWIVGTNNYGRSTFGSPLSDAYVAKLDREGRMKWETVIARNRENAIHDVALLPTGDVVLVGKEDDRNWLLRLTGDGQISWERTFGVGRTASVTNLNGAIVVAAFGVMTGENREQVAVWRFNAEGELIGQQTVRNEFGERPNAPWLKIVAAGNAAYVVSAWTELLTERRSAKAVNVAKVDEGGGVVWTRDLPETITKSAVGPSVCSAGVIVMADQSVLVSCRIEEGIRFIRLEPKDGGPNQVVALNKRRPNCVGSFGLGKFMVRDVQDSVWLFGTGQGCVWLDSIQFGN